MTNRQFLQIITIIPIFWATTSLAQTPHRSCATTEVMAEQIKQDPTLIDRIEDIEHHTQQFIARPKLGTRNSIISIPVVVHVVYRTQNAIENISDEQILSQIDVLNKDYRRLNEDRTNTPSVYDAFAADCSIEFKLAKRTPAGKATTGIMRHPSIRLTTWGKNDEVKMPEKGGIAPWDPTKYMNIYVCAIGGGVLGYSTMPGTNTLYDGIVIDYRYFGSKGTVAPFDKGRTTTHEIGHWLNLRHIWGDNECGNDGVTDTPVQFGPNYGCVSFPHKSCGNQASGDMFMNFMDYTDDACMNMFTKGQRDRILAAFATGGTRASLINSDALTPPNENCTATSTLTVSLISTTSAQIKWSSVIGINDYIVEYREKGATKWIDVTIKGATNYTLTNLVTNKNYECRVLSVCSNNQTNYSSTFAFTTLSVSNNCVDIYEFNNTFSTAKEIPVNTAITALIDNQYDNDYFLIKNDELKRDIKLCLTNLPADYDVRLYDVNHQLIGSSTKSDKTDEKIIFRNAPVGIYYVRVYPNAGNSSSQCYKLSIDLINADLLREDESTVSQNIKNVDVLKVFPNPVSEIMKIEIETEFEGEATIRLLDMTSREILHTKQSLTKDINNLQVDVNNLRDGVYMLHIQYGNQSLSKKAVIHKNF